MGRPIQILDVQNDQLQILHKNVSGIFKDPDVRDRQVVLMSISGAFRQGKSFMLNWCLLYLSKKYSQDLSVPQSENWWENAEQPLTGFPWQDGPDRVTTGIWIWSEIFKYNAPNGQKLAIAIMDTQGIFDDETTRKMCAHILNLSAFMSSVIIWNVSHNIQEDDVQHLQTFLEYGRIASRFLTEKPFQKLLFLVRDWANPRHFTYGIEGGQKFLSHRMRKQENLWRLFEQLDCFLMPHPGDVISKLTPYDGKFSLLSPNFQEHLKILVPYLLAPENLVIKKINGNNVTFKELTNMLEAFVEISNNNDVLQPETIFNTTATMMNSKAVEKAMRLYEKKLEEIFGVDLPPVPRDILHQQHDVIVKDVVEYFRTLKLLGGDQMMDLYKSALDTGIEKVLASVIAANNNKHERLENIAKVQNLTIAKEMLEHFEKKINELRDSYREDVVTINISKVEGLLNKMKNETLFKFNLQAKLSDSQLTTLIRKDLDFDISRLTNALLAEVHLRKATLNSHMEVQALQAIKIAAEYYKTKMNETTAASSLYLTEDQLKERHAAIKREAAQIFSSKIGAPAEEKNFESALEVELRRQFETFQQKNKSIRMENELKAELHNGELVREVINRYERKMESFCLNSQSYIEPGLLKAQSDEFKMQAVAMLESDFNNCDSAQLEKYRADVDLKLQNVFSLYHQLNVEKLKSSSDESRSNRFGMLDTIIKTVFSISKVAEAISAVFSNRSLHNAGRVQTPNTNEPSSSHPRLRPQ